MWNSFFEKINQYKQHNSSQEKSGLSVHNKFIAIISIGSILFIGIVAVPNIIKYYFQPNKSPIESDIIQYNSVEELSQQIGFGVKEIENLPFKPTSTIYMDRWGKIAEIVYQSEEDELVFRMARGNKDISNDYNKYYSTTEISGKDYMITIRGNEDKFNLAVWNLKDYSYSIKISTGISEEEMIKLIESTTII